ncbi:DNA-3-methyladenine glycosylase I [Agrilactobacillus fermenti]|uniref:DNA-3-methyladenine glycosylase I n=1 Tax=Agrilactobacillus fermenti TaxID=2586909 RepID=UPI003A5BCBEB
MNSKFDPRTIPWPLDTPEILAYSRDEWGQPLHGDQKLFELLTLEIFQAGLRWQLILEKRSILNAAFHHFDVKKVGKMIVADVTELMTWPKMIKNRRKIMATIDNAKVIQRLQKQGSSLDAYLWNFVGHEPVRTKPRVVTDVTPTNHLSVLVAKHMKKAGFKFVGPTIIYSFIQAAGLVDNHLVVGAAKGGQ